MKNKFEEFFERVKQATHITTQTELADVLGLGRAAVTDARKRNAIPKTWVKTLEERFGLNPHFLTRGDYPVFIDYDKAGDQALEVFTYRMTPVVEIQDLNTMERVEPPLALSSKLIHRLSLSGNLAYALIKERGLDCAEINVGDRVLIDLDNKSLSPSSIFLIKIHGSISLYKVILGIDGYALKSDDQEFPYLESKMEIVGKVRAKIVTL